MPRMFDNIEQQLLCLCVPACWRQSARAGKGRPPRRQVPVLQEMLKVSERADFCI
jgi:hypothetical protein